MSREYAFDTQKQESVPVKAGKVDMRGKREKDY
jgi:hypothetical protein